MTVFEKKREIPWFSPMVGEREKELILDVLSSNYLNDGPVTRRFEAQVAELLKVKHCVAVTNGTSAITLVLIGLGVGPGDEVIVPDLTFIATANAVRLTGASVRLVDVDSKRLCLDPEKIQAHINSKTRAIVTVDVNGRGADYGFYEPLCREKNLFLVCDSAEALGSRQSGRPLGSFGDAGCLSFSPNKTITTGQGGMIATNNTSLFHRLLELKDQGRRHQGTGGDDDHPVMGFNFKLTNLQAAVGLAQLEKLPARLEKSRIRDGWYRQALNGFLCIHSRLGDTIRDGWYRQALNGCKGIRFPETDVQGGEILQWTDILVEKNREPVRAALTAARIGHRAFWFPLHTQGAYSNSGKDFEVAVGLSSAGLWLPSHFDLSQDQVEWTAQVIRQSIT